MRDSFVAAFASPHLIDVILVFTLVEAVGLFVLRRWTAGFGRRAPMPPTTLAICLMLLPGIFLMLAIRAALAEAVWPWLPAALAGALLTHLLDLRSRWRG